jgi:hypothetical protein
MSTKVFARTFALIALALATVFTGQRAASAGTDVACFRILHAAPEAGPVDVYANRTRVAANLAYTQTSARRYCIATTEFLIRAFPPAANPSTTPPLVSGTVVLEFGKSYLIAITGYNQSLQVVALEDPVKPPAGQFALRVINVAPNVPALDLIRTDATALLSNVTFPSSQIGNFPAGAYDLQIRQTGTTNILANLGTLTFASGQRQTIYVFAPAGGPAASAAATAGAAPLVTFKVERER